MQEIEQQPATRAVFLALLKTDDPRMRSDLLFLEAWEMHRPVNLGATLRASQIRRANPDLAAAIERELKGISPA
jgi:hypothetical protein